MGDQTGLIAYMVAVALFAIAVVLADLTRSVTVTDTLVSVRTFGFTVSVPVGEVRRVVREELGGETERVVVFGRRLWHYVRIDVAAREPEIQALENFLSAAEGRGVPVFAAPAQAA